MELRALALQAFRTCDVDLKLAQVRDLCRLGDALAVAPDACLDAGSPLPGRPARPELIDPAQVPQRNPNTLPGRTALIHAICHIEFNAINLALDAIWRFAGMPKAYYLDWLHVAVEEVRHFTLLHAHLQTLHHRYGDFPAHDGLWTMCETTRDDIVARMALVPRTLEARGLDATPQIQARLRTANTADARAACDILDTILHDEIGHVAIGNRWYGWLCAQQGLEPMAHYRTLLDRFRTPRLRGPINVAARLQAGFTVEELHALRA